VGEKNSFSMIGASRQ